MNEELLHFPDIGASPCEGCDNVPVCKSEDMSCQAMIRYMNGKTGGEKVPSRAAQKKLDSGRASDTWLAQEEDIALIASLLEEREKLKRQLNELSDAKIIEKFEINRPQYRQILEIIGERHEINV